MNRKNILPLILIAGLFVSMLTSCSSSKNSIAPRKDFKGNWEITSVVVEGAEGKLNITAFDDADIKCFEGSEWYLPNNGYGSYTINKGDCATGTRQILWSQRVNGNSTLFNFKKMDGVKKKDSKDVVEGYSLEVISFEGDHFAARSSITFEGKPISIIYNFSKR